MRSYTSCGIICVRGLGNMIYHLCKLTYILNEDDSFKYIFEPNYSVMDLVDLKYFQGIPGLNLDLKKKEYIRDNIIPTFISERVPQENREDYYELLEEVGLEYMDPILYLIRTKKQYSGDNMFMISYSPNEKIIIDEKTNDTNTSTMKKILDNICAGNDVVINNQVINDSNRKIFHDVFMSLYLRAHEANEKLKKEGINKAKEEGIYKGRKPIFVDEVKFLEYLNKVEKKEITPRNAAKELGISIDKYYRFKKQLLS